MLILPLLFENVQNDYQTGQTSFFMDLGDAKEYWENYHGKDIGLVSSFGYVVQSYLQDAPKVFNAIQERENRPNNALEFWKFTKEYIESAENNLPVNFAQLSKWNEYKNLVNLHIQGAFDSWNTRANQNVFMVISGAVDQTAQDIGEMAKKTKKALDPRESILPFIIAGAVLLALTR